MTEKVMDRWRIGHRLFFVLIQGEIIVLRRFNEAVKANDLSCAYNDLAVATLLMLASSVAFKFTGDFSDQEYEEIVRPSMSPPHVGQGFSGLLSLDHLKLIEMFKVLKRNLTNLPEELKEPYQQFMLAVDVAYQAHIFVCAKFKGGEQPSLRMSETTEKTAVEILEGLRRSRGNLLGFKKIGAI